MFLFSILCFLFRHKNYTWAVLLDTNLDPTIFYETSRQLNLEDPCSHPDAIACGKTSNDMHVLSYCTSFMWFLLFKYCLWIFSLHLSNELSYCPRVLKDFFMNFYICFRLRFPIVLVLCVVYCLNIVCEFLTSFIEWAYQLYLFLVLFYCSKIVIYFLLPFMDPSKFFFCPSFNVFFYSSLFLMKYCLH